jgi:hypothetical protein
MKKALAGLAILLILFAGCKKKDDDPIIPITRITSPITVEVTTPPSPQTGEVTIDYLLIDDRVPPVNADIIVYYSKNGGPFKATTQGAGGDGITNLTTAAAPGAAHTYVWNATADLGPGIFNVVIKIVPYDTGTTEQGTPGKSGSFQVVNIVPTVEPELKVYDPKLAAGVSIDIDYRVDPGKHNYDVTVKILDDTAAEVRRLVDNQSTAGGTNQSVAWDGRDDGGNFVDTGDYDVVVEAVYQTLPAFSSQETVHIVRLGVSGIEFVTNGADSEEFQLMYHVRNTSLHTYYAIPDSRAQWAIGPDSTDVADLDTDDGQPRPLPAVWTDLNSPPQDGTDTAGVEDDNYNLPACYERAARPKLQVTLGSNAASDVTPNTPLDCNYPVTGYPIRMVISEANPETAGGNEGISPGGTVSFIAKTSLPNAVQKNTLDFNFTFEYQDGTAWVDIPGSISTSHTIYTIFDKPMLTTSPTPTAPYLPWVKLVDLVCEWIDGPTNANEICDIVVQQVNTFFGLQYDTSLGACHYTTGTLASHTMEMSSFIEDYDDATFTTVNCSDCACTVITLANTVGVDHEYQILGYTTGSIPLNYMIPIGRDWVIPFSGSFSYHAVSTRDSGNTISDACCTLDNDANPSSPPHVPILPVNMDSSTYDSKLSWNPSNWGTYTITRCAQH